MLLKLNTNCIELHYCHIQYATCIDVSILSHSYFMDFSGLTATQLDLMEVFGQRITQQSILNLLPRHTKIL